MKFIFKRWRKNLKSILIIFIGMILGILALSIGLSFLKDAKDFSKELEGGDSDIYEMLLYKAESLDNQNSINKLDEVLKSLNKDYEVTVGSVMYMIDRDAPMSDAPSIIPKLYNKNIDWRPNLIYGRYLTIDESLSDKKIAVIGLDIYKYFFKDKKFESDMTIDLWGQKYSIVGVVGRTKRYCPQNTNLQIPYKNYFEINNQDSDPSNISIIIRGDKKIDIDFDNNLSLVDKPTYVNDIKIPIKLVAIIGVLLLLVTIINEGSLFSNWIINRRKEIAIKKALGATNAMIIKETLCETILISVISVVISLTIQYSVQIKLNTVLNGYELNITFFNYIVSLILSLIISLASSMVPAKIILSIESSEELK